MYGLSLVIIIIIVNIMLFYTYENTIYIKSSLNDKYYLVQNIDQKETASNILAKIDEKISKLINYLNENIKKDKSNYIYIKRLIARVKNLMIMENPSHFGTSYSVNKGDKIVLCLRSKSRPNTFHDINTIMYVTLHELSHVACPEYDHTRLFHKIFKFLLKVAIHISIYKDTNYKENPQEYCGLTMNVYVH
jgi:predicted metal-dependent hydrolase